MFTLSKYDTMQNFGNRHHNHTQHNTQPQAK